MPYNVNRYNGVLLTTVPDQTVDSSSTDLRFVGKNYAGYGEILNENFLALLEHFRGETQPRKSIPGQLWYDELNNKIKFRSTDNQWRTLAVADVSSTPPTGLQSKDKGNIWYDDTQGQLSVWNGTDFELIGPERSTGFGETKLTSDVIRDNSNIARAIIKLTIDDDVIGVISNQEFTIGNIESITGFTTIKKGVTLIDTPPTGITSSDFRFWGTASNSQLFNDLDISNFVLRSPSGSTYDDAGMTIGTDSDLKIHVINGDESVIENQLDRTLRVRIKSGSTNNDIAIFSNAGILPGTSDAYNIGSSTIRYREIHARELYGSLSGTVTGDVESTNGLVMLDASTEELNGTLIGDLKGSILDSANNLVYDASTKTFNSTNVNTTNITADTLTLNNRVVGDIKGDVYASDDSIAYNAGTKDWYGTFNGDATSAGRLSSTPLINGVAFDGTANITIVDSTKINKSGDTMIGNLTITATPTLSNHAVTKNYVDQAIRSRDIFMSLDTRGLNTTGIASLLNTLAPVSQFNPGTRAHIAGTSQNVTSTANYGTRSWIGITTVTSVSVTTTVNNPTRNNDMIFEVNQAGTSWVYVSG